MANRGRPRRSGKTILTLLWVPSAIGAIGLGAVANNMEAGAITGAIIGFVIGLGLASFPDLDRGGPDDSDDMFH